MTAYVPRFVPQLDGSQYAGLNCTMAVGAMLLDRETLGRDRTTGARVRQLTGDTMGGTTQRQMAAALHRGWDVDLDVETPIATATGFARLDKGEALGLGGQSAATRGTKWQSSETFTGNHQWGLFDRRKNSQSAGGHDILVMDPLGDGRRPAIADFSKGGLWLPENLILDFARRLDLDGQGHPLGYGKLYAVFTHDTEPHLVLRFKAKAVTPPARKIVKVPAGQRANVRTGPNTASRVIQRLGNGDHFTACQVTSGTNLGGSRQWFGNIDGTRWMHESAF